MTITIDPALDHSVENQHQSPKTDSLNDLKRRLNKEVTSSRDRIQSIREEAAHSYFGKEENLRAFTTAAKQIHTLLSPRLQALADLNIFEGSRMFLCPEIDPEDIRSCPSQIAAFSPPFGFQCPAKVELSFQLRHDHLIENAILSVELSIIPIFLKFEKKDELIIPIESPDEKVIGSWIDEKLVGFTRTFVEISFHSEYQKKHLVADPVMKTQFPKAFAVGERTHEKKTYYFYTQESMKRFEATPENYVESDSN